VPRQLVTTHKKYSNSYTEDSCCAEKRRYSIATERIFKIHVFWDVTLCRWVNGFRRFEKSIAFLFRAKQFSLIQELNLTNVALTTSYIADGNMLSYLVLQLSSNCIVNMLFE
jgi:hypothetical protein